jgi:MFS family permease
MADRIGRKPVLVFSLGGVTAATALFGLSRTLWQMILFRCVAGLFAGSVVTVRTMLSENTEKTTQGKAFAWYSFARNVGLFLGPLVGKSFSSTAKRLFTHDSFTGGGLANPATLYPGTFGGVKFFEDYPYALATFTAGVVCLTATLSSLLFLKETLHRGPGSNDAKQTPPLTTLEVLNSPGVKPVLFIFGHTMLLALGYTAMSPVFLYTHINHGGLEFKPQQISYFIALAGISQSLWMLLVFPPLQRKIGTGAVLRICAAAWPIMMAVYPLLNEFARRGWFTAMWTVGAANIIMGSGVAMAFGKESYLPSAAQMTLS